MRLSIRLGWVVGLALCCVVGAGAQDAGEMLEGVRIPLDQHENGVVKTQVTAERARVRDGGVFIDGEGVVIEIYDEAGQVVQMVHLERCRVHRDRREADSDGLVRFEAEGVVITGRGFRWRGEEESVKILSQAKVELSVTLLDMDRLRQARR